MAQNKRKSVVRARAKKIAVKRSAAPKAKPRQRFVASHYNDADFKSDGLRTYAKYRDLGIKAATNGQAIAHVIRFVPPCDPKMVSKNHFHDVDFQMIYVLKGWIKTELEGQGAHTMNAGSAWLQPRKIKHKVLDYSDDCEVLEIVLPGDFKTVELEK
jgi:quercetin dioxygenase-like cupin family protein